MASVGSRAGIAIASAVAAGLLGYGLFALSRSSSGGASGGPVRFDGDGDSARDLLLEREEDLGGGTIAPGTELLDGPLKRETLTAEDVVRLFPRSSELFEYDPHTFYRYRGGLDVKVDFADYPGGSFRKITSEEGFDEDFARLPEKIDFLAVVTGDSHTDGMCANRESFANRLEAVLAERHPGAAIEVLNTAATGYSFYSYLGVLEKLVDLGPKAFVVAFYSGNDFVDLVKPWHFHHHTALPPKRLDYWEKLNKVKRDGGGHLANALHQALYFQYYPAEVENTLTAASQVCLEIQRICEEKGIALVVVHIPLAFRVDGELQPELANAKELLELSDSDLQRGHRLADRLIEVLRRRGVVVLDMREAFTGDLRQYYWSDLHINLKGQQTIADQLLPRFETNLFAGRK